MNIIGDQSFKKAMETSEVTLQKFLDNIFLSDCVSTAKPESSLVRQYLDYDPQLVCLSNGSSNISGKRHTFNTDLRNKRDELIHHPYWSFKEGKAIGDYHDDIFYFSGIKPSELVAETDLQNNFLKNLLYPVSPLCFFFALYTLRTVILHFENLEAPHIASDTARLIDGIHFFFKTCEKIGTL